MFIGSLLLLSFLTEPAQFCARRDDGHAKAIYPAPVLVLIMLHHVALKEEEYRVQMTWWGVRAVMWSCWDKESGGG